MLQTEYAAVVVPGVTTVTSRPMSHWGGIVAGLFSALALLALLGELGMAAGLSAADEGARLAPYAVGAGIWGIVALLVAFFVGGYVASRLVSHGHPRSGLAQGGLVWAVAVVVMGVLAASMAISTVTAAGVTTIAAVQADPEAAAQAAAAAKAKAAELTAAERAAAPSALDRTTPAEAKVADAARKVGLLGWAAVLALLLSLGAAFAGGAVGARGCKPDVELRSVPLDRGEIARRDAEALRVAESQARHREQA